MLIMIAFSFHTQHMTLREIADMRFLYWHSANKDQIKQFAWNNNLEPEHNIPPTFSVSSVVLSTPA